ncbi:hypothetical protein BE17_21330 [Sorangium cellulosum]|uniref:RNA polymerase sigma-70 region 2 domain-containing protein n=1 Tax=Sorangium cellulosum TaxID=56 RepID=A0A150SKV0_SORCE|nr:hypothetical protein BE17_21330 [Sorangium cellulosum]
MSRGGTVPPGGPLSPEQQALVKEAIGLVRSLAATHAPHARPEQREELLAYGYTGAVLAASRFDPARGVRFTSYAYSFIDGEIRDGLKWERKHRRLHVAASWAARSFVAETSDRFDVAWDDEATNSGRLRRYAMHLVKSMVLGVVEAGDTLDDTAADMEDRRRAIEIVRGVYAALDEAERHLYVLRYVERKVMEDVAAGLGVSVSTARRRHDALLDRMTAALLEGGVREMPPRE